MEKDMHAPNLQQSASSFFFNAGQTLGEMEQENFWKSERSLWVFSGCAIWIGLIVAYGYGVVMAEGGGLPFYMVIGLILMAVLPTTIIVGAFIFWQELRYNRKSSVALVDMVRSLGSPALAAASDTQTLAMAVSVELGRLKTDLRDIEQRLIGIQSGLRQEISHLEKAGHQMQEGFEALLDKLALQQQRMKQMHHESTPQTVGAMSNGIASAPPSPAYPVSPDAEGIFFPEETDEQTENSMVERLKSIFHNQDDTIQNNSFASPPADTSPSSGQDTTPDIPLHCARLTGSDLPAYLLSFCRDSFRDINAAAWDLCRSICPDYPIALHNSYAAGKIEVFAKFLYEHLRDNPTILLEHIHDLEIRRLVGKLVTAGYSMQSQLSTQSVPTEVMEYWRQSECCQLFYHFDEIIKQS